ncbi:MAG TPA: hypothetical protein VE033_18970 [Acetobacteraceae bacterium]|jgi:hypothetical protein|nr:hypothetical protein [Acetobacteraceae bacterium]
MSGEKPQPKPEPHKGQVEQDSPANGREGAAMSQEEASTPPSDTPAYPARGA